MCTRNMPLGFLSTQESMRSPLKTLQKNFYLILLPNTNFCLLLPIIIPDLISPSFLISPDQEFTASLLNRSLNLYLCNFDGNAGRGDSVIAKMIKLGERMDLLTQEIRDHVRLGPKLSETVKGKLSLGARILQMGGVEKVFKQKFNIRDDEKLLKASQCYLSTTAGPIAGLLFVSTNRVAFCSERCIKISSPIGKLLKVQYKVMIRLRKIKRAHECENVKNPAQKYVHLVTGDNFDFWFMGFLNHQRTLKFLQQVIHQAAEEFIAYDVSLFCIFCFFFSPLLLGCIDVYQRSYTLRILYNL
ncbi:hypothetical protein Pfo_024579 [Paulownia fortunei]|nr:hypothetical protein Pfo_024579 [Paulownia fortunei]